MNEFTKTSLNSCSTYQISIKALLNKMNEFLAILSWYVEKVNVMNQFTKTRLQIILFYRTQISIKALLNT